MIISVLHGVTYIGSITPCAGAESFEHAGPTGGGGGVAGAAGRGAAAAVRYGFRILHCYFPPDLGHSAGLKKNKTRVSYPQKHPYGHCPHTETSAGMRNKVECIIIYQI